MAADGDVIFLSEPAETWKANLFWGLLFGLLMIVPSFFVPEHTPLWKKYGMMILGVAWLTFMCRKAFQNHGRKVRCDLDEIEVSQPSGSRRIPISEVKKVVREDIREELRKWNDIGRSRYKTKPLDTLPAMVVYTLYDDSDRELLRLDKNMKPAGEMHRFLERMETLTGRPIIYK
ncbi:MAG: hypothetical protein P4L55_16235 [Syntrophobacteraceae bacterium]|nr:hypothetical protein [Syntrophobacteraceae bacterium]